MIIQSNLNYPNPNELLNKRSELISKCRHVSKFLSSNYKSIGRLDLMTRPYGKCPIRYK